MAIKAIYLAGGMHSDWRERIKEKNPYLAYFDPMLNGSKEPGVYTEWDLAAIRGCDTIIAYMSKDNPSGFGMSVEMGYGKALGKRIVLIDELQSVYWGMHRVIADEYFIDFDEFLNNWHQEDQP